MVSGLSIDFMQTSSRLQSHSESQKYAVLFGPNWTLACLDRRIETWTLADNKSSSSKIV